RGVGDDFPVLRGVESQRVGCLHIRLVEAGKDALGIRCFKLGVQIHLVVYWINEAVQAFACARVGDLGVDFELVFGMFQPRQRDAVGGVVGIQWQGDAVEAGVDDFIRAQVNKRRTWLLGVKVYGGHRREILLITQV